MPLSASILKPLGAGGGDRPRAANVGQSWPTSAEKGEDIMKTLHAIAPLFLVLALGVGIPSTAADTSVAPAVPGIEAACTTGSSPLFAEPAAAPAAPTAPATDPLFASPPVCNPFCVTSPCTRNSDCTAAPNGRCNFACPQTGCCVYN
jgi:hypothetical protein